MGHDRSPLISKLRMSLLDGKSRLSTALLKKVLKYSAKEEESDIIFYPTVPFSEKNGLIFFQKFLLSRKLFKSRFLKNLVLSLL